MIIKLIARYDLHKLKVKSKVKKKVRHVKSAYATLNEALVLLFNGIFTVEEKALITDEFKDISITDMHIIEVIGFENSRSMSSIAKDLDITVGTLTIAINNLVKKDYVKRERSTKDRRVVLISLSRKGKKAFIHHANFHKQMIQEIIKMLEDDELEVFIKGLKKINAYFKKKK